MVGASIHRLRTPHRLCWRRLNARAAAANRDGGAARSGTLVKYGTRVITRLRAFEETRTLRHLASLLPHCVAARRAPREGVERRCIAH